MALSSLPAKGFPRSYTRLTKVRRQSLPEGLSRGARGTSAEVCPLPRRRFACYLDLGSLTTSSEGSQLPALALSRTFWMDKTGYSYYFLMNKGVIL